MQDDLPIDQNPTNTRWVGVGRVVSGLIGDVLRIKYH